MPSIYKYVNYREFLRDLFIEQKQQMKPVTHRAILKKMGVSSTGFLSNVIAGKKNLSSQQSSRLSRILGLASREQRYFSLMASYTQAKALEEKKKFLDRLMSLRKTSLGLLQENQFDLFSKWYYVYVRDLLCFVDFRDDYDSLAKMLDPEIKASEAEDAIHALETMGLIARTNSGFFRPTERIITTGDEAHSVHLANFQLTTMDMAKRALEKVPAAERDISFVSMTLPPEGFTAVKSAIQDFRKRLLMMAKEEKNPQRVYQCNIQFYPVSKIAGNNHG
jgi:uncharacterized protein (TIGR02147 family)